MTEIDCRVHEVLTLSASIIDRFGKSSGRGN